MKKFAVIMFACTLVSSSAFALTPAEREMNEDSGPNIQLPSTPPTGGAEQAPREMDHAAPMPESPPFSNHATPAPAPVSHHHMATRHHVSKHSKKHTHKHKHHAKHHHHAKHAKKHHHASKHHHVTKHAHAKKPASSDTHADAPAPDTKAPAANTLPAPVQ